MHKRKNQHSDAAAIRVLVRIAWAAHRAADHLLLRSVEIELADYGMSLADVGIDITVESVEVRHAHTT